MKERILFFVKLYLLLVLVFVLQKPLFMLYYHDLYADATVGDWLNTMLHGLRLDLSVAGYLTALPGLLLIASAWGGLSILRKIMSGYFLLISSLIALIFTVDLGLYEYWGFRLDTTPLFYFFSSPADALASVSIWVVLGGLVAMVSYAILLYYLFYKLLLGGKKTQPTMKLPFKRFTVSLVMLLLTAMLMLPIRGGFTVSTNNTGKVYFSPVLRLNHAAINPAFSLMESMAKESDFASQYRFMDSSEADCLFAAMVDEQVSNQTSLKPLPLDSLTAQSDTLFATQRPNVLILILESFSAHLMESLGGHPNVAVSLDSLAQEGVLFTRFYANSFRTDRGLVAILSGYPAQPTTSMMKYPRKSQHIPAIAGSLRKAGYATHYYYGGDADFTNMRSYLMSSGFDDIVSDQDFPISDRLSKWGVHDHLVFDRLLADLTLETEQGSEERPFYRVLQTSSSHEPFEVPYQRLDNPRLNAFAYTDSCVGDFVQRFRRLPQWKNTVVILVPDHLGAYPEQMGLMDVNRYHIPLLMIGGAVRAPRKVDVYASQQDLAATLLAQLDIPHGEFRFSKDIFNPHNPHFAFFTMPDAFGMLTDENQLIFNNQSGEIAVDEGEHPGLNLPKGKAYLQKLFDDIASLGVKAQ